MSTTTVAYVPEPGAERLDLVGGQRLLHQFVTVECDRLGAGQYGEALAQVAVDLDEDGNVIEARLDRRTGDDRMDGIIGAVAARLRLGPQSGSARRLGAQLRAGYKCQPDGPTVVLQRL